MLVGERGLFRMQNTLADAVIPAQRQHAVAPSTESAPALSTAGRDVVVEQRRGGLPRYVRALVAGLDVLAIAVAVALAWPLRAMVPGVEPATSPGMSFSFAVAPLL